MIAFYAWTDTILLNAYRIKMADYSDEPAALIILNLPRVSETVVKAIEQTRAFDRIVRINNVHEGKRGFIRKAFSKSIS